ncbi:hypothetical protein ACIQOW_20665 [Kitasatospora sp. NPDC091335]|uniref:hypothetical protein n=1 Tax=Kitasatospora sp. NPDC091335 TaxID=3364085 RepID=UPI00382E9843
MLTGGARRVRLGQIFGDDVPLGSLGSLLLDCHSVPEARAVLHGDRACRRLGLGARPGRVGLAAGPLCGSCAWTLPADHPVNDFALAVAGLRTPAVEVGEGAQADLALTSGAASAQPARAVRVWRRAQTRALQGFAATAAFPWLKPWAGPRLFALTGAVEQARGAVVRRIDPRELLAAACVAAMPAPVGLRDALPACTGSWGADGEWLLAEAWTRWQSACAEGEAPVADCVRAASAVVYEAFGRRRKGRDEALDNVQRLITSSIDQARRHAEKKHAGPVRLVQMALPLLETEPLTGREHDPLTPWQAGVIAVHQFGVDWSAGQVTLTAPLAVADLLLGG